MTKEEVDKIIDSSERSVYITYDGYTYSYNKDTIQSRNDNSITFPYSTLQYTRISHVIDAEKAKQIDASCSLGSDPEFFFVKNGKVVPSELIIEPGNKSIHPDGFQGEINPQSSTCRESAGSYIAHAMKLADSMAKSKGASISLEVGHIIDKETFLSLAPLKRRFGCHPTLNVHESNFKRVTGLREQFRAAAGHIHIGAHTAKSNEEDLVKLLDIVAGNTCVLIDRDINNARRRIIYGRAGEYRLKDYGIEYRVLSNFWLKSYVLWSLASGLCRNALALKTNGYTKKLLKLFDMDKVRKAINTNDKELAMENFMVLVKFIKDEGIIMRGGLSITNIDKCVKWFSKSDPINDLNVGTVAESMKSWKEKATYGADGFEKFIGKQ